jgi:hypothetical protein
MIDQQTLSAFMSGFYGYGRWDAPLWFIGMEEGGGNSWEEIARRVSVWEEFNRPELADLHEFHALLGVTRHSGPMAKLQRTWTSLTRIALAAEGRPFQLDDVRNYQGSELGSRAGQTALIELLPLPSPSTKDWFYAESGLPELATRERYRDAVAPHRVEHIRESLSRHRPRLVVFYGIQYRSFWESIAQTDILEGSRPLSGTPTAHPLFVLAPHPASRGVTGDDYERIGRLVRTSQ